MAGRGIDEKLRCSFCNKTQDQVKKLISGPNGIYICDQCVSICSDILDEEFEEEDDGNPAEDMEINLLKPKEIKEFLSTGNISELSVKDKMSILRRQLQESVERIDERRGILHIRRHLAATPLFKGIPNFRDTRIAMLRAETVIELTNILDYIENTVLKS